MVDVESEVILTGVVKPTTAEIPQQWMAISATMYLDRLLLLDGPTFAVGHPERSRSWLFKLEVSFDLFLTLDRHYKCCPQRWIDRCSIDHFTFVPDLNPKHGDHSVGSEVVSSGIFENTTEFGYFMQDGSFTLSPPSIIAPDGVHTHLPGSSNGSTVNQASFSCRCGSVHGTLEPHRPRRRATKVL